MWRTSVMPVGCLLMCVQDMLVVKWRVDDDVCDVRVTLSKLFTSGPVGSRCRDPSWTVVHSNVRSYYEWCQTTCFLSSEEGCVISAPCLRSFGLSTQSKRLTRVQPSYCPQSVHHSDRRSFTLSVNIYAVEAPHSCGKNNISHQPLCFSLSALEDIAAFKSRWNDRIYEIYNRTVIISRESLVLIVRSLVFTHLVLFSGVWRKVKKEKCFKLLFKLVAKYKK